MSHPTRIGALAAFALAVSGIMVPSAQAKPVDEPLKKSPAIQNIQDSTKEIVDEFIVTYKNVNQNTAENKRQLAEQAVLAQKIQGRSLQVTGKLATGSSLVKIDQKFNLDQQRKFIDELKKTPGVLAVTPNSTMYSFGMPNDPELSKQWHLSFPMGGLNMRQAYDLADGKGQTVAVIDTGIVKHSDLTPNVLPGYDLISKVETARDGNGRDDNPQDEGTYFDKGECNGGGPRDSSWHGSHVAGTIAAVTNNGKGVAGVAPKAKILPVRVLGKCGSGTNADVIDAIMWAAGAEVKDTKTNTNMPTIMNMSLGSEGPCTADLQQAIDYANSKKISILVAAGNENKDAKNYNPANCKGVITVGSADKHGNKASYSNFGSTVTFSSPGGETSGLKADGIYSTVDVGKTTPTGEGYQFLGGTSMATPAAAGVVALLRSAGATHENVTSYLTSTAHELPGDCKAGCGAGLIDPSAALRKLKNVADDFTGTELIKNGGFEQGKANWTESRSGMIGSGGNYKAAAGNSKAVLSGQKYPRTDTIKQSVSIPSSAKKVLLRFKLMVVSEEQLDSGYHDTLTVTLGNKTVLVAGDMDNNRIYSTADIDVSDLKGKTVDLTFAGKEDSFRMSAFLIDEVSMKSQQ